MATFPKPRTDHTADIHEVSALLKQVMDLVPPTGIGTTEYATIFALLAISKELRATRAELVALREQVATFASTILLR